MQSWNVCTIDGGTLTRTYTLPPGFIGKDEDISGLSLEERFKRVLELTAPKLPVEIREEFTAMLTPQALGIIVVVLAAWAASHYFGIGFIADVLILLGGVAMIGWQVWTAAGDLYDALTMTYYAKKRPDLDAAAGHLANFIAVVGVAVFMALVMKGAKGAKSKATSTIGLSAGVMARRCGMTVSHFEVFKSISSAKGGLNRIIAVRYTNPNSTPWIARGYPAKPMKIKVKTNKQTGIVTASNDAERSAAKAAGYYVVDDLGVPRNSSGMALDLPTKPDWPLKPGQVIDGYQKKPLVGDYDLLSVIDPNAPGRNIVMAVVDNQPVPNRTNPDINRVKNALNSQMDQPRVMHGAHDGFGDLASAIGKAEDGAVVFFPDGRVSLLETLADVEAFYREIGRQTIRGVYPAAPLPASLPSNVIRGSFGR